MDVITSHINADFDSLASAVAAKKLYPEAVIVFPGSMEKRVRDFIEVFKPADIKKVKDIQLDKVTRLIIVDTKHPDRIGPLKELLSRNDVAVHIYDHHPVTSNDIDGEVKVLDTVGAVSTLFAEIIQKKRYQITPMEATLLCLGIYEETGSLDFHLDNAQGPNRSGVPAETGGESEYCIRLSEGRVKQGHRGPPQ